MRRIGAAVAVLVLAGTAMVAAGGGASAAPAGAARAATACPTGWGSGLKGAPDSGIVPLADIRTGRHDCFRDSFAVHRPSGRW